MDSLAGHLLIAGPSLFDPSFRKAVVFIAHHDDEGAVGVVLNRSLEVPVSDAVPPMSGLVETAVWMPFSFWTSTAGVGITTASSAAKEGAEEKK